MSGPVSAWTCPICGQRYNVPSLARDCEAKCREIVWAERGGHEAHDRNQRPRVRHRGDTGDDGKAGEPDTDPPAIFDVSRAETQIRPQWDHDGPRPTALGFQPNEAAHG